MAGFFLTFEGVEGGGKTTQARLLAGALRERGHAVLVTREPGGTELGKVLRRLLLEPADALLATEAELLLLLADRAQHVQEVIVPGLRSHAVVISDRFMDSTLAYQGYGRGITLDLVRRLNSFASRACLPDFTVLLDLPVRVGLRRARQGRGVAEMDRFEAQALDFHHRVQAGFLTVARENRRRVHVIDADQPIEPIHQKILSMTLDRMKQAANGKR